MGLGVTTESLVGICVERSLEMVIGILGILKAGGAYVPLDPDYPEDRIGFMLADASVAVLLSQGHLKDRLPKSEATMVYLDDWCRIGSYSTENPNGQSGPITWLM